MVKCVACNEDMNGLIGLELLRRTNSDSAHNQSEQAWLKFLCHKCHTVFVIHFLYGRKEISQLLDDGGKIAAVRLRRLATGEGLYEAKHYVDKIEEEKKHTYTTEENIT